MKTITDNQKEFEYKVCQKFKFNTSNSCVMQREGVEQMILDDFNSGVSHLDVLSGTIAFRRKDKAFLLVATKDSEVNYIDNITLKMIRLLIDQYCEEDENQKPTNKVIFATNIPILIHSQTAKEYKNRFNFHIQSIGYSFCQKHNLEFTQMY